MMRYVLRAQKPKANEDKKKLRAGTAAEIGGGSTVGYGQASGVRETVDGGRKQKQGRAVACEYYAVAVIYANRPSPRSRQASE